MNQTYVSPTEIVVHTYRGVKLISAIHFSTEWTIFRFWQNSELVSAKACKRLWQNYSQCSTKHINFFPCINKLLLMLHVYLTCESWLCCLENLHVLKATWQLWILWPKEGKKIQYQKCKTTFTTAPHRTNQTWNRLKTGPLIEVWLYSIHDT